jgi:hypothetical protein
MADVRDTRRTILIDFDGCMVENPPESFAAKNGGKGIITDPMFWHNHWVDVDTYKPYDVIVELARVYVDRGYEVIVLTARPSSYYIQTRQFLDAMGLHEVELIMRPEEDGIGPSQEWKVDQIHNLLSLGRQIDFMIEDYPSNAEAIRKVLPVLLFERVK